MTGGNPDPSMPGRPHLRRNGSTTQLMVDARPMLVLAGEAQNSNSTSRAYMQSVWQKAVQANFNTVLAVIPWDLVEPEEGTFDFTIVDELVFDARKHGMKLIPLWFGTWKNGLTHYAPHWVKSDTKRFPRFRSKYGNLEVVTPLSQEAMEADARAFAAVMRHVRKIDEGQHTVIMVQVENEVGTHGEMRDRSAAGEAAFAGQVPAELMDYLQTNLDSLIPETLAFWNGRSKKSGTWSEVFEEAAEEVFMAWHYARFLETVTAAGKAEYDVPMFVNAALSSAMPAKGGHAPSGGPTERMQDIWRAGAPSLDMLCPDIYTPNYEEVLRRFNQAGNPIFVPEARPDLEGAANAIYTFGHCGIGYSPFGFENRITDHANGPITRTYRLLSKIAPVVLSHQAAGSITGARVSLKEPEATFDFGGFRWTLNLLAYWRALNQPLSDFGSILVMQESSDTFLVAGFGAQVRFGISDGSDQLVAISSLDEVEYEDGRWVRGRRLSGDEIMNSYDIEEELGRHQTGTQMKFWEADPAVLRVRLYAYEK